MAKKDKKSKKLKDSGIEAAEVVAVEEELEVAEEAPVETDSAEEAVEAPEAVKAPAKRTAKKVEIPASSLEFVAEFPLEQIIDREPNTRFRGKETETVLARMIQEFGWVQPLTLDAEYRIVDGQYRLELARKWKLKTVPVVISGGVSAAAGTTDLFHMLAGRIIEWDKWNFPGTDAVLRGLDGGLGTEEILDFEATSEAGHLRDLAREIGWFIEVIPKRLSGSTVTLENLATLLKKQLAGKYHYDPAQLLYIEALREQLQNVRTEMVANGETAGGVKPKLEQHLNEEARKLEEGEAIAAANGYEMVDSEDGKTKVFNADPEITYVANKVAEAEEAARVQIRSARDMESRFREMADGKKMGLTQFKILATYFGDMTIEEAGDFFNAKSATEFNAYVDQVLEENRTVSANRSKNFPMTEAELRAEQYRLRSEDMKKDAEKNRKDEPKGLNDFLVAKLKELLKAEGLPLSGNKGELVQRLKDAGYRDDGTKGDAPAAEAEEIPVSEAEEAEATAEVDAVTVAVDELMEDLDDSPMIFTADSTEETSGEPEEDPSAELTEALRENADEVIVGEVREAEASNAEGDYLEVVIKPSERSGELQDPKELKKRGKELKKLSEERDLTKAEQKELKAIKKALKS